MRPFANTIVDPLRRFPLWKFFIILCLLIAGIQSVRHTAHHYAGFAAKFTGKSASANTNANASFQGDEECLGCRVLNWSKTFIAKSSPYLAHPLTDASMTLYDAPSAHVNPRLSIPYNAQAPPFNALRLS
jgi:hypothetical protein